MTNKIFHAIAAVILFAIPVIFASHNGILDLTIGGLLNAIYLAVSQYVNPTVPTAPLA